MVSSSATACSSPLIKASSTKHSAVLVWLGYSGRTRRGNLGPLVYVLFFPKPEVLVKKKSFFARGGSEVPCSMRRKAPANWTVSAKKREREDDASSALVPATRTIRKMENKLGHMRVHARTHTCSCARAHACAWKIVSWALQQAQSTEMHVAGIACR